MERDIDYFKISRLVQMKSTMKQLSNLSSNPIYFDEEDLNNDK